MILRYALMGDRQLELKSSDKVDRAVFNAIPIPAFVVDDDAHILDMNAAAAHFCGRDLDASYGLRGGEVLSCVHSNDVPEGCGRGPACKTCVIRNSVKAFFEGQPVRRARTRMSFLPVSDQKSKVLLITTNHIPSKGERLALLIVEDITANAELEQALRRSEQLAVTGRLIATIAHEFNTPLDSLNNLIYLLRMEPGLGDGAMELLESAEEEVSRLTHISRQTLAPHREAKRPVATNIAVLLDDAVALFQRKLESAKINVHRNYQSQVELVIQPSELRQVFTNLIANAIDAMQAGGELNLRIEKSSASQVVIRISDTGCGIPSHHLKSIFDLFFTTKGEKGSGIGLWVIKGIIEKLGGKIEVASSIAGKTGTSFTIRFPATKQPG
jgi:signal transduction histidine kinase